MAGVNRIARYLEPPRVAPNMNVLDRLPPSNLEAEEGVLGSILLDPDVLPDVVLELAGPEDFYRDSYQTIYRGILALDAAGIPISTIALADELERRGEYDRAGGDEALAHILSRVPHAAHARYYAGIVRQKALSRGLIEAAGAILKDGYSNRFSAPELLGRAEKLVYGLTDQATAGRTGRLGEAAAEAMDLIARRARGEVTGLSAGWSCLDGLFGGLEPGELVVVAARPSMGKTAFALNLCENLAFGLGLGILFVSLEMGKRQLAERLLCSRSGVFGSKVRTGNGLSDRDMIALDRAYAEIRDAPVHIDDTSGRTAGQVLANARRLRARHGIVLLVIDYLGLIDTADAPGDNLTQRLGWVSGRLKNGARELGIPVLALHQLNRKAEDRKDHRPMLSDLRDSGNIEQDADKVLLLHRPDYYNRDDQPGLAEVIIAKNRGGPTDTVKFAWNRELTRFEELTTAPGEEPY